MTDQQIEDLDLILDKQIEAFKELQDMVSKEAFLILCQNTPLGVAYNSGITASRKIKQARRKAGN